ncbi:hypothetical protein [Paenibacillus tyrfis]|uniref:hypothetical protein n=1 Tax=Paenibacillus tyrfis TaxID=1501230 RepID=UPI00209F6EB5|nr:hypothetical protein [Paenibacillus tyrfis]MCP1312067.1 hypothetical protein [Paenibacillus tyrfis]
MREITLNEKELLAIVHSRLIGEIKKNEHLLKENHPSPEDQKSPRYIWREGCIDTLNEIKAYIEYLQRLKYL